MSDSKNVFTRANLEKYLRDLAKENKKLGGNNIPAEITLIGGASILINLYNSWDSIPKAAKRFIDDVMKDGNYKKMLDSVKLEENRTRESLLEFEEKYPNVTNKDNVDNIIARLRERK